MSSSETGVSAAKESSFADYLKAEPVLLALLFALAVVAFTGVTGLSRLYYGQQESLGQRWFGRGVADLNAHNYDAAALEFRTSLRYSRDNYSYQLNLAEALLGLKRTPEAQAYLVNLFDRQPENGFVNLELARIAAQGGESEHALRYYHNAIYATWSNNAIEDRQQRREARIELIEYLLRINSTTQAQAELIALEANLGEDPEQQRQVGDFFVRARDYEHALAAYRASLKLDRHNAAAEAGAGLSAFQLGQYQVASRYLQLAVADDPNDASGATLLKTTELVLQLDPYEAGIGATQRAKIVVRDFAIAGTRLQACGLSTGAVGPVSSSGVSQRSLGDRWALLKTHVTERGLERDPDLADQAMQLVSDVERQTAASCGTLAGDDQALLTIANSREGR
jgi:tetratricopeptide (TPR) repeat protein